MKSLLIVINLVTILSMFIGGYKLKRDARSVISTALFIMVLGLCAEVAISSYLVIITPINLSTLMIRICSRALGMLGVLWFMRAVFRGNHFIEAMLFRDLRDNK